MEEFDSVPRVHLKAYQCFGQSKRKHTDCQRFTIKMSKEHELCNQYDIFDTLSCISLFFLGEKSIIYFLLCFCNATLSTYYASCIRL
jgi:hypothetical protein